MTKHKQEIYHDGVSYYAACSCNPDVKSGPYANRQSAKLASVQCREEK